MMLKLTLQKDNGMLSVKKLEFCTKTYNAFLLAIRSINYSAISLNHHSQKSVCLMDLSHQILPYRKNKSVFKSNTLIKSMYIASYYTAR